MERSELKDINLFFLFTSLTLVLIGGYLADSFPVKGLLFIEYILLLIPCILFIRINNRKFKEVVSLRPVWIKELVYIILMVVFSYPLVLALNYMTINILQSFGNGSFTKIPLAKSPGELRLNILIMAVTPGICEEIFFRGLLFSFLEEHYSSERTIVITSILFGIIHFNIYDLFGPIFLGLILGRMRHRSNSVTGPIIFHILYNSMSLIIGYYISKMVIGPDLDRNILILGFIGVCILSGLGLRRLIRKYPKRRRRSLKELPRYDIRPVEVLPLVLVFFIYLYINLQFYFLT